MGIIDNLEIAASIAKPKKKTDLDKCVIHFKDGSKVEFNLLSIASHVFAGPDLGGMVVGSVHKGTTIKLTLKGALRVDGKEAFYIILHY